MNFTNRESVIEYVEKIKPTFHDIAKAEQLEIVDELLIACGRFELDDNIVKDLTSGGIDMKISDMEKEELQSLIAASFKESKDLMEGKTKAEATIVEKDAEIKRLTDENTALASNLEASRNTIAELEGKVKASEEEKTAIAKELSDIKAETKYTARIDQLTKANIDVATFDDKRKEFVKTCDDVVFAEFMEMFAAQKKVEPTPEPTKEPNTNLADASKDNDLITTDVKKEDEPKIDMSFIHQAIRKNR